MNINVGSLLGRIDSNLEKLYLKGEISEPTREKFFREYLDCHPQAWKNWYSRGVRKIYVRIIDLLESN